MIEADPDPAALSIARRGLLGQAKRVLVIAIGFAFLGIGLVLVALPMIPGGLPSLLVGLGLLSTEVAWARRLRERLLSYVRRLRRGADSPADNR